MRVRTICFAVGILCVAIGIMGIVRQLPNLYEVPPVFFIGLFCFLLGYLLSRKGPVRRTIAFIAGILPICWLLTIPLRLFSPGRLPIGAGIGVWVISGLISGALAFYTPGPRNQENEKLA